jgi:hypothetical protein
LTLPLRQVFAAGAAAAACYLLLTLRLLLPCVCCLPANDAAAAACDDMYTNMHCGTIPKANVALTILAIEIFVVEKFDPSKYL